MELTVNNRGSKILLLLVSALAGAAVVFISYEYIYPFAKTITGRFSGSPYLEFSYFPEECGTSGQDDSIDWTSDDSVVVSQRIDLSGACSFTIEGGYTIKNDVLTLSYEPHTEGMCWCANQPTLTWKLYNLPSNRLEIKFEEVRGEPTKGDLTTDYWNIDHSGVYYTIRTGQFFGGNGEEQKILLNNADPAGFIAINEVYGKDADRVFCRTQEVQGADTDTFQVTTDYRLAKDKNNVYFCDILNLDDSDRDYTVLDADPGSFIVLPYRYAKDKDHVYWDADIIEGADAATFVVYREKRIAEDVKSFDARLPGGEYMAEDRNFKYHWELRVGLNQDSYVKGLNDYYAKDDDTVYFNLQPLEADYDSFEVIDGQYARDKDTVYMDGKKNEAADPASFEVLSEAYARDKNYVYREYEIIPDADPGSFMFYSDPDYPELNRFAKDKNRVYCDGTDTFHEGADPDTFEHLDYIYSRDKNRVYFNCNGIIEEADPQSFKALSDRFAVDKNHAYYDDRVIAGADPDTFGLVDEKYKITKDKNHVYIYGKSYPAIDVNTFEYLGHAYCIDRNGAYEGGFPIREADGSTFEVLDYRYTKDNRHVFCRQTGVCDRIIKDADPATFRLLTAEELQTVNWQADAGDKNNYYKIGRRVVF